MGGRVGELGTWRVGGGLRRILAGRSGIGDIDSQDAAGKGYSQGCRDVAVDLPPQHIRLASTDRGRALTARHAHTQSSFGYPKRILHGHNGFVSDVVISSDGQFALSSSWDKTLRLWDLNTGLTTRRFVGHTSDVLSVSFSADNRQIVSGSRDRTIKLWNTLGECKFNITEDGHSEWVSCVRFSPNPMNPVIVSAGWDKIVKVSGSRFPCVPPRTRPRPIQAAQKKNKSLSIEEGDVMIPHLVSYICYFRGTIFPYENTNLSTKIADPPLPR